MAREGNSETRLVSFKNDKLDVEELDNNHALDGRPIPTKPYPTPAGPWGALAGPRMAPVGPWLAPVGH